MKCIRCGRKYDSPVPKITNPDGIHEIACVGWCAACNTLVMSVVLRDSSAYRTKNLYDPMKERR